MSAINRPARSKRAHTKEEACRRLALVQGQVRGLLSMIEGDRECVDVLTQVASLRAALDSLGALVLTQHVADLSGIEGDELAEERAARIREAMARFLR